MVQVQGKVRAKLEVPADIDQEQAERAALAEPNVIKALAGRSVAKVIVRLPGLVSIVPGAAER